MTGAQILSFALVGTTVLVFIWGRWRYDVVALGALAVGTLAGIVPADRAFSGFANDIVIIIASALVLSAAVARSGLVERLLRPIAPRLTHPAAQVPVLAAATAFLSMVTKNVGALALMMPPALQIARRTGVSPARLLMPMSFASLVGGLAIMVGTSPNIIVAEVRAEATGRPFGMFDFTPVGLGLTAIALVYLTIAYRILPASREPAANLDAALAGKAYVTEAAVPEDWPLEEQTFADLSALHGEVNIVALVRDGSRGGAPSAKAKVQPGDILLLEGEQADLDEFIRRARLTLTRSDRPIAKEEATDEVRVIEAVIGADSLLVGKTAGKLNLHSEYGVNLLGVSRAGYRHTQRLQRVKLRAGDILALQGGERALPGALQTLGLLPLAERELRLGGIRRRLAPPVILAGAMVLVATGVLPVAVAFFAAALLVVAIGTLRMREAYQAIDAPVLVLVAALIPVSDTIQSTGGADLIAQWLSGVFQGLPPIAALVAMMAVAMAATPFLSNAATVLIVAPIGMSLAQRLGLSPDPFLMAVAVGAGCDFLTPVGHQCNTLIFGPGGYKFADYARLGAPLTAIVLLAGPPLITLFWPL